MFTWGRQLIRFRRQHWAMRAMFASSTSRSTSGRRVDRALVGSEAKRALSGRMPIHPTTRSRCCCANRPARAPGGTRQVASYSSMISGPSESLRQVAPAQDRRVQPLGLGPKYLRCAERGGSGRARRTDPACAAGSAMIGHHDRDRPERPSSGPARCPYVRSCSRPKASSISLTRLRSIGRLHGNG